MTKGPQRSPTGDAPGRIRVLLLGDTHIGLDLPVRPRVSRRRRGFDFLANMEQALRPALEGLVDAVVHGGDLLDRGRVPTCHVEAALEPLVRVAESGVPVFLVPGNHERGRIPNVLLAAHPRLHILAVPTTHVLAIRGARLAVAGFPFERQVAVRFEHLLAESRLLDEPAEARLLCIHQAVEGAQVGAANYTFRRGADVVPARALPSGVAAVLAGHIHRSQVLRRDLTGRPLAAPVVYAGAVERTSFAEREETKHFAIVTLAPGSPPVPGGPGPLVEPGGPNRAAQGWHPRSRGGSLVGVEFVPLPARPMSVVDVSDLVAPTASSAELDEALTRRLAELPPDSVVQLRLPAGMVAGTSSLLSAGTLRDRWPHMNVTVSLVGRRAAHPPAPAWGTGRSSSYRPAADLPPGARSDAARPRVGPRSGRRDAPGDARPPLGDRR